MKKEELEAEEIKTFEEFRKEAEDEVRNFKSSGKLSGIVALLLSIIGFIFIFIFFPVSIILGFIGLIFAKKSINNGFILIGKTAGLISFFDILGFAIQVGGMLASPF